MATWLSSSAAQNSVSSARICRHTTTTVAAHVKIESVASHACRGHGIKQAHTRT
jgi:hypothetical protein